MPADTFDCSESKTRLLAHALDQHIQKVDQITAVIELQVSEVPVAFVVQLEIRCMENQGIIYHTVKDTAFGLVVERITLTLEKHIIERQDVEFPCDGQGHIQIVPTHKRLGEFGSIIDRHGFDNDPVSVYTQSHTTIILTDSFPIIFSDNLYISFTVNPSQANPWNVSPNQITVRNPGPPNNE